ncbi:MAG: TonB-dependent receptor [Acidobacteriota bacterium]|nr:TonB-dependent receptor [Acidobacteriota bacterium]
MRDGRGGEPLARVAVSLEGTPIHAITDGEGRFDIKALKPGDYTLSVSTVGYKLALIKVNLANGQLKEFEVTLTPDNLRQTTTVEVNAGPFGAPRIDSPSEISLSGNDAKNLASVLADDPLRAVQALPGITSDDDFNSRFSLRGADYSRIGLYVDDVLLHQPFHMIEGASGTGSLTIVNGDMLDNIDVQSGVYPAAYGDSTAAAVDLQTREGSQVKPSFRVTASASNSGALGEGPLGKGHAGDWILSVRKSYLQYIVDRVASDSSFAFGFWDYQGRVTYNLAHKNRVSVSFVDGYSSLDRTQDIGKLGLNDLMTSHYHYTMANLGWNFTPNGQFLATSHVAYIREAITDQNKNNLNFDQGQYGEWVWNSNASWMWHARDSLNFGWSMRRIRDDGFTRNFQYLPYAVLAEADYRGTALRMGGYGEQVWKAAHGRIALTAGLRWDKFGVDTVQTTSPQVTLALIPWASTRINFGWGQYAQEPDPNWAFSALGGRGLLPERANSLVVSVEQQLDQRTRLRLEFYDRQDRDLLFRPFLEPRLYVLDVAPGAYGFFPGLLDAPIDNALRGYARGMEIFLQRHSANRLTGWISYSLGYSRMRDGEALISFPADQDQRHTVNVYLGYRLRPTVNLSVKSIYGSGMPIPGFYSHQGTPYYYLSSDRNALREKAYESTDVRVNKAWAFDRWKLTLYAEAVNILNRTNPRYESFRGYNTTSGTLNLGFVNMLPILPSAGVVLEF